MGDGEGAVATCVSVGGNACCTNVVRRHSNVFDQKLAGAGLQSSSNVQVPVMTCRAHGASVVALASSTAYDAARNRLQNIVDLVSES